MKTDIATVGGVILASAGVFLGIRLEGIHLYEMGQLTAALVVFCGTAGAVLISMPLEQIKQALKAMPSMLKNPCEPDREVIEAILGYARNARINGLLSLEPEAEAIVDPHFRQAMRLAIDAVGPEMIKDVLSSDCAGIKAHAETIAAFYESAAGYAPTLGMAGAAIGLIQVMKHLEHIDQVGMGVAAAFVATIYGVLLANLVLLPIATKIRARAESRLRVCGIIREGVLLIATGSNPALIRLKLEALSQVHENRHTRRATRSMSAQTQQV